MRLKTEIWLKAYLHQCTAQAIPFYILHRGDADFGTVILRLNTRDGMNRILVQATGPDGEEAWMGALDGRAVPDDEAEVYLKRQTSIDPDAWVVEIEHPDAWHPFPGALL